MTPRPSRTLERLRRRVLAPLFDRLGYDLVPATPDWSHRPTSAREVDLLLSSAAASLERDLAASGIAPPGDVLDWTRRFWDLIPAAPVRQRRGGSGFNGALQLYVALRALAPRAVIESGVFRGLTTWVIRQACPDAAIHCHDPDLSGLQYRDPRAAYGTGDWSAADLSGLDPATTVAFFDDHVSQARRVVEARRLGLTRLLFDDDAAGHRIHAHGGPAHPTIAMVAALRAGGEPIRWQRHGRAFAQAADDPLVREAADAIAHAHAYDDLHRATGYAPARLTYVALHPASGPIPHAATAVSRRALIAGLAAVPATSIAPRAARAEASPRSGAPETPLVVDLAARGRKPGTRGGTIRTLIARARDVRYLSVYGYTRLVGYDADLALVPDVLERVAVEGGRCTFTLRRGHRWSDGHPFTTEDFRYYWENVAGDRDLSPGGPPDFFLVDGRLPAVEILDPLTVRYVWGAPNPRFLPALAAARDPLIYRPAHYLKPVHPAFVGRDAADALARAQGLRGWAALHNRMDDNFELNNPDAPTLQGWRPRTRAPATRFVFERNPHYHRVDAAGTQLPYLDRIVMDVASAGLLVAKTNAGEADLMFRGLSMADLPSLKAGERAHGYRTNLWPVARGSEVALYPNLTILDPGWRALNRDVRYRRALSLAIDRRTLNNTLLFGLGTEGNDTVIAESPLFAPDLRTRHAAYDPEAAGRLLDAAGLGARDGSGLRLMPDGRLLEVVVESDGEAAMVLDALLLIGEFWREVGVKLVVKPQERTNLRRRSVGGMTVMVAAQGLDLAAPTAIMPPTGLSPAQADHYSWPRWSLSMEMHGASGEPCDVAEVRRLLDLDREWRRTDDPARQAAIWRAMLENHADNTWVIGTVAGALQPVVAADRLANVPARALYAFEPTAMIGVQRLDEVFWDSAAARQAGLP